MVWMLCAKNKHDGLQGFYSFAWAILDHNVPIKSALGTLLIGAQFYSAVFEVQRSGHNNQIIYWRKHSQAAPMQKKSLY